MEGHDLGKTKYKNRLYAYCRGALTNNDEKESFLLKINNETDRLFDLVNSGLHIHRRITKEETEEMYKDIIGFVIKISEINSKMIRNSYFAYKEEIDNF